VDQVGRRADLDENGAGEEAAATHEARVRVHEVRQALEHERDSTA
jgi:hypothetical protein